MKKRLTVFLTALIIAAFAVTVGFAVRYAHEAENARRLLVYEQSRSVADLTESMNDISDAFIKGRYAYTPELLASISAEIWLEAESARASLSHLAADAAPLDSTCRFIAQAGDYAFYLMKRAASGDALTAEERASLAGLSDTAKTYAAQLTVLSAEADAGILPCEASPGAATVSDEMSSLEQDFPEYATLIYDGPLSDHIQQQNPAMTQNAPAVTQSEALSHLAEVCGCPASAFTDCTLLDGRIPAYCFHGAYNGEPLYGEVTRNGGYVLTFLRSRDMIDPKLTPEEGLSRVKALTESIGLGDLRETYYYNEAGLTVVNLAAVENGVTCYPDLVKIGVSLDDGTLLRLETRGYLMNHHARDLQIPASADTSRETLDDYLTVCRESCAVIPTDGGNEVLCREYLCQAEDGTKLLVYCDASTGRQRQIFILISDENGTLTL